VAVNGSEDNAFDGKHRFLISSQFNMCGCALCRQLNDGLDLIELDLTPNGEESAQSDGKSNRIFGASRVLLNEISTSAWFLASMNCTKKLGFPPSKMSSLPE